MENGGGSFEERVNLGEGNGPEEGSSTPRAGNGETRVCDDNEMKDSEADEVFEEAVEEEVDTPSRQEDEEQKELDVKTFAAGGNTSEENFDGRTVNGDPGSVREIEHFEEAVEVPTEGVPHEDVQASVPQKVDGVVDQDAPIHSDGAENSEGTAVPIETNGSGAHDTGLAKENVHVEEDLMLHVNRAAKGHLDENLPEKRLVFENENSQGMKSFSPEKLESGDSDHMETNGVVGEVEDTVEVPVSHVDEEKRT